MKLGPPLSKEESERILNMPEDSDPELNTDSSDERLGPPITMDDFVGGDQNLLWQIARELPKDVKHAVFQQMYGQPHQIEKPSFLESMGYGADRYLKGIEQGYLGLKDLATGSNDLPQFEEDTQREIDLYNRGRGEKAGFDWGAFTGQALPAAGIGMGLQPALGRLFGIPSSLAGTAGVSATESAALSGLDYSGRNESTLAKMALGGIIGGAAPFAFAGAGKLGQMVGNKLGLNKPGPQATTAAQQAAQEAVPDGQGINLEGLKKAAQQQLDSTGNITDDVLARRARLESMGFTGDSAPTSGQLTQSRMSFSDEQNLQHLGDLGQPLRDRFDSQGKQFTNLFDDVTTATGARNLGQGQSEYIGHEMVESVIKRWNVTGKAVGRLYREIERKYGNQGGIGVDDIVSKTLDLADDESMSAVTNSVLNRFRSRGLLDANNLPTGKTLTVSEARGIRTWIGNLSNQGAGKHAKREIISALDDSVVNATGDDYFKAARDAYRSRAVEFEKDAVKKIVGGNLQGNQMINTLRNASSNRIQDLKWTLEHSGKMGRQAWDEGRGQLLYELFKDGPTKTLVTRINKMGDKKLKLLFPESFDKIKGITQSILDLNVGPPGTSINRSFTAPTALNYLQKSNPSLMSGLGKYLAERSQRQTIQEALAGNAVHIGGGRTIQINPIVKNLYGSTPPVLSTFGMELNRSGYQLP